MPISKPARRLLHHAPLSFVRRAYQGGVQRPLTAALSLTSMIDFLVVAVVFLLLTFSASSEGAIVRGVKTPPARNAIEMVDAPMVSIAGGQLLVDGTVSGTTRLAEEQKRIQRIDELFNALKAKRETWKLLHPDRAGAPPSVVVLQIDQDTPAVVVKSVVQTAAHAGYPEISFMVQKAEN
jgi:biopolymer transport protein ExbD